MNTPTAALVASMFLVLAGPFALLNTATAGYNPIWTETPREMGEAEGSQVDDARTLQSEETADPVASPSSRSEHDMAYDAESDRVILFGGWMGSAPFSDTWAYDYNANEWQEMNPATSPSARRLHAMAYDEESDRVILYGGVRTDDLIPTSETWAYDFNTDTWTDMNPATNPPARWGRVAYDVESDRVVLFGGAFGHLATIFNDTWVYDYNSNTWTVMSPRPSRGTSHAMAYDRESDRIVVFGGESAPFQGVEGTWVYDLNNDTWFDMDPSVTPPLAIHYASAFDVESDRIILWGGFSFAGFVDDIWTYDLNANVWASSSTTAGPSERNLHRMAYDTESDRAIMFGGSWATRFNNETWAYHLNENLWTPLSPLTPPDAPRDLRAAATGGQVSLTWQAPIDDGGYPITSFHVYRRTASEGFSSVAEEEGAFPFSDPDVTMGSTYFYVVRAVTRGGEGPPSNEATVMVPDSLDPMVAITTPTKDEAVNTLFITASGTATDNVALETVEVSTDGTMWTSASLTGSSWSAPLILSEGPNTIHARATDTSGNTAEARITVTATSVGPSPPWLLIGISLAVGAGAVGTAVFMLRRRRRQQA